MAKLILSLDGAVLGNYFLDKDRFTIGRKPSNDIQIDDAGVSKEHAVVTTVGNDQILEDNASTNGTLVNGERTTRRILQNGDVIQVSRYQLKYVNQKAMSGMDFDRTMMIPALAGGEGAIAEGSAAGRIATAASTARAATVNFPLGAVKGIKGTYAGREIELKRPLATFGKPGAQVAMIARRPHGYFITHVEGNSHPIVNGRSVGTEPHLLQNGDVIEVGEEMLEFSLKP
jgi:pSer/pThr/pTyr-binding forkhead associated (FHA) protein